MVERQRLLAVQLDAGDLLVLEVEGAFRVGDGAAGDEQDLPRCIGDDLLVGEVDDVGGMLHNVGEDGDVAGVLGQGIRQDEVKGGGVDQRLVAHQLQVKVGILDGADLPDAAGRGIVVGAGHQIAHAVGLAGIGDALVIGSDEDVVQLGAGFGGLVDPPDHGFAQHIRQRLAGHTGACITGRDHSDCFHKDTSLCRALPIVWHTPGKFLSISRLVKRNTVRWLAVKYAVRRASACCCSGV